MEELKDVLKRNGVFHLYNTLKENGVYNIKMFSQLSKQDIEILDIDEYIDKLRLNKILDEIQKRYLKPIDDLRPLSNQKIIVVVRKRPPIQKEDDAIVVENENVIVNEHKFKLDLEPYTENHSFNFDVAFKDYDDNTKVYSKSVKEIVRHVSQGGSGSIIAYGQTGSGKTYTMMESSGMVELALKDLVSIKNKGQIVFCEIYLGQVYDLLNERSKILLREVNGVVHLTNVKSIKFNSYNEISKIIKEGLMNRRTGVTGANIKSSRSHAVIIVNFGENKTDTFGDSDSIVFVDLAGSERGSDRQGLHNDIKNEGAEINKSLLALKECIRGIEKDQKHLPFRQSKLTQILKNSFIGTSKTCIIATVSPSYDNVEHSLNTLRYASRIKETQKGDHKIEHKVEDAPYKKREEVLFKKESISHKAVFTTSSPSSSSLFNSSHSYADQFSNEDKDECYKVLEEIQDKIKELDVQETKDVLKGLKNILNWINNT
jgi:kinesin family protein 2/24